MKRGTTYPFIITLRGIDLTGADWVIVSLKGDGSSVPPFRVNSLEFGPDDINVTCSDNVTRIAFQLTEAQSVAITSQSLIVDVNWKMNDIRGGAKKRVIDISDTLLTREVNM